MSPSFGRPSPPYNLSTIYYLLLFYGLQGDDYPLGGYLAFVYIRDVIILPVQEITGLGLASEGGVYLPNFFNGLPVAPEDPFPGLVIEIPMIDSNINLMGEDPDLVRQFLGL